MNESVEMKLVKQRLSALQLAEALGNVSEACRRRGISRMRIPMNSSINSGEFVQSKKKTSSTRLR